MLTRTFWVLLLLLPFLSGAQQPALITLKNKYTQETYQVLKGDTTVRQGEYAFGKKNSVYLKGQYDQNEKAGLWEAFDLDGKLTARYDYDKDTLLFYKKPEWDVSYRVINLPSGTDTSQLQPPVYLLDPQVAWSLVGRTMRYPEAAREAGMGGKILVSFVVERNGKTGFFEVKEPIGYGLDEEAMRVVELLPDVWLPAKLNGHAVETEITIPLTFRID